ncbi:NAD-dependent succinate-semialdehyde dehydrogenase [Bauldia sp.]|uniref:NAD-dependent succinate-semialdehyde dehydrogenase n=1 Tax=Bauldia sp. TaxID=2575872 RepID=UPI003BA90B77
MPQDLPDVPTQLSIGGVWRDGSAGETIDVIDPATEAVIARVASASVGDGHAALDAADAAFADWAARTPRDRGEVLRKAFTLMIDDRERLARIMTLENGKALSDSRVEITYAAEFFRWYAEEAVRNIGEVMHSPTTDARILVHHKPAGIAVLVTPWNFPTAMGTRKIGPALAAGCPVIVKPASETPLSMLALMPILEEAGLPPGVVNVIPTRHPGPVVDSLLDDMRVRVLSFTGSTGVGRTLLKAAARNIVNPSMELGGNAPFIVCHDADIDAAVDGAMLAKMRNIGEACTAANRILVDARVHDAFANKLTDRMAALAMGNGLDKGVAVGALVSSRARETVHAFVTDALAKGATLRTGGTIPPGSGFFYPPTVLTDVPDTADCIHGEIFGPVAVLQSFADEDEAIAKANATDQGLTAYLYTQDLKRGLTLSERLAFGMVGLNRGIVSDPAAPFGGVKQSGIGREGGHEGLMEFLETQYIAVSW